MKKFLLLGAAALTLGACVQAPTPLPVIATQQAVISPAVSSPIRYNNPLEGYTYRGPTGPRDWRSVNEEQSEGN